MLSITITKINNEKTLILFNTILFLPQKKYVQNVGYNVTNTELQCIHKYSTVQSGMLKCATST